MNEQFIDRVIKILMERTDLPEPTKADGNAKLRARYQGAGREMKMAGDAAGYASSRLAYNHYHKYRGRRHEQPVNPEGSSTQERRRDAGRRYIKNLVSTGNQGTGLPIDQLRVGKGGNYMYGPYSKRATILNPQEARQLILNKFADILIEQHKLRSDNLGGRGQSGGQLKHPGSRKHAADVKRVQRGLNKMGVPPAKKIAEGKRSKKLARAKNPDKIEKLKASQERGDSQRALKAGKGGEDALNRMFGIGKRGS